MARAFGLVGTTIALLVGMYLYATAVRDTLPSAGDSAQAREQAATAASEAILLLARTSVESHHAGAGTFAGATVPPGVGVVVARADATSYCLQAGTGESAMHLPGPGGEPAPGPC